MQAKPAAVLAYSTTKLLQLINSLVLKRKILIIHVSRPDLLWEKLLYSNRRFNSIVDYILSEIERTKTIITP